MDYLVIQGKKIRALQNISFNYSTNEQEVLNAGKGFNGTFIGGATQVTANIDKFLVNNDSITGLTGRSDISGQFAYGGSFLNFCSGALIGYTVSANVGSLPEIAFDISIYGDISGSNTAQSFTLENQVYDVNQDNISVVFDKSAANPIQGFTYSENYNFQAIYGMNNNVGRPSEIQLTGPINQEMQIDIEVEDFMFENNFSFLSGSKDRNRNISVTVGQNVFSMSNAFLVGESKSLSVSNTVVASLRYRGFKNI
jgi:hypothetical protein